MNFQADHYFLDTEFSDLLENSFAVEFLSIGLVGMERSFYGVPNNIDDEKYKGTWLYDNVIAKLPPQEQRQSLEEIRAGILGVFGTPDHERREINIWAHNSSYDHFAIARLFNGQLKLRELLKEKYGIRRVFFRDTKELLEHVPAAYRLPVIDASDQHTSINDARKEQDIFYAVVNSFGSSPGIRALLHSATLG